MLLNCVRPLGTQNPTSNRYKVLSITSLTSGFTPHETFPHNRQLPPRSSADFSRIQVLRTCTAGDCSAHRSWGLAWAPQNPETALLEAAAARALQQGALQIRDAHKRGALAQRRRAWRLLLPLRLVLAGRCGFN